MNEQRRPLTDYGLHGLVDAQIESLRAEADAERLGRLARQSRRLLRRPRTVLLRVVGRTLVALGAAIGGPGTDASQVPASAPPRPATRRANPCDPEDVLPHAA